MKEEVNKIKCSTGRSEEAMRRTKNESLDFTGFEGNGIIISEKKLPTIPAFPEERPRFS
jgi:hypothetical protein